MLRRRVTNVAAGSSAACLPQLAGGRDGQHRCSVSAAASRIFRDRRSACTKLAAGATT